MQTTRLIHLLALSVINSIQYYYYYHYHYHYHYHYYTRLMALCLGLPGWACTRKVKSFSHIPKSTQRCKNTNLYSTLSEKSIPPNLVQIILSKYAIEMWSPRLMYIPYLGKLTYLTLKNFKTLKITNSAIKEHLVGNKWSKSHFICPWLFQSGKKLTKSVQNVFYLNEHVLSVSFSTHWSSHQ